MVHPRSQIFEGCVVGVVGVCGCGVCGCGVCAKGAAEEQEMDTMRQVIPAENEMSPLK